MFLYKNHQTVVKAYSRLKKKYDNLEIEFIGNYKHNLKLYNNLIDENSLINESHFTGELNRKDLIKTLIESDIFVFASSTETFGISLLEAAAVGKPLISCEIGTGTSFVNIGNETGLVVTPGSSGELRLAMQLLLDNPNLAAKLGKNGKKRSQQLFSVDRQAKSYFDLYSELLSKIK